MFHEQPVRVNHEEFGLSNSTCVRLAVRCHSGDWWGLGSCHQCLKRFSYLVLGVHLVGSRFLDFGPALRPGNLDFNEFKYGVEHMISMFSIYLSFTFCCFTILVSIMTAAGKQAADGKFQASTCP